MERRGTQKRCNKVHLTKQLHEQYTAQKNNIRRLRSVCPVPLRLILYLFIVTEHVCQELSMSKIAFL